MQFGSDNEATRKFAALKYKRKSSALLMDAEDREIEDKAATIAAKQASERLKSKAKTFRSESASRGRFGRNNGGRSSYSKFN